MKLPTTPSLLFATLAISSSSLAAPIDGMPNSPDLRSPAIGPSMFTSSPSVGSPRMGSPAIRTGSGSRRALPRYQRKRDITPTGAPSPNVLDGLGISGITVAGSGTGSLGGTAGSVLSTADGLLAAVLDDIPVVGPAVSSILTSTAPVAEDAVSSILDAASSAVQGHAGGVSGIVPQGPSAPIPAGQSLGQSTGAAMSVVGGAQPANPLASQIAAKILSAASALATKAPTGAVTGAASGLAATPLALAASLASKPAQIASALPTSTVTGLAGSVLGHLPTDSFGAAASVSGATTAIPALSAPPSLPTLSAREPAPFAEFTALSISEDVTSTNLGATTTETSGTGAIPPPLASAGVLGAGLVSGSVGGLFQPTSHGDVQQLAAVPVLDLAGSAPSVTQSIPTALASATSVTASVSGVGLPVDLASIPVSPVAPTGQSVAQLVAHAKSEADTLIPVSAAALSLPILPSSVTSSLPIPTSIAVAQQVPPIHTFPDGVPDFLRVPGWVYESDEDILRAAKAAGDVPPLFLAASEKASKVSAAATPATNAAGKV